MKYFRLNLRARLTAALLALALVAGFALAPVAGFAGSAQAACPAPGTGSAGAANMGHDPTMGTIPMTHDVQGNGNAGMTTAVDNSGC